MLSSSLNNCHLPSALFLLCTPLLPSCWGIVFVFSFKLLLEHCIFTSSVFAFLYFVCFRAHMLLHACRVCGSQFSFYRVCPGNRTRVVRLGSKQLYHLEHWKHMPDFMSFSSKDCLCQDSADDLIQVDSSSLVSGSPEHTDCGRVFTITQKSP